MKICSNCGNQLQDDAKFCNKCGAKQELQHASQQTYQQGTQRTTLQQVQSGDDQKPVEIQKPNKHKKKGTIVPIIIVAIVCLVMVAVGLAAVFFWPAISDRLGIVDAKVDETTVSSGEGKSDEDDVDEETDDTEDTEETKETKKMTETKEPKKTTVTEESTVARGNEMFVNYYGNVEAYEMQPSADGEHSYEEQLIDGRLDTAWMWKSDGGGEGQQILLYSRDGLEREVCGLRIYCGYQKSDETRNSYGEPLKIRALFDDGTEIDIYNESGSEYAELLFPPISTIRIILTVEDIRPGTKYQYTCISEIRVKGFDDDSGNAKAPDIAKGPSLTTSPTTSPITSPITSETMDYTEASMDYIFPDSSSRYLTDVEVATTDKALLRYARNEIYARHGWIFKDAELSKYFNTKVWYAGTVEANLFDEETLNEFERANCELIKKYEE